MIKQIILQTESPTSNKQMERKKRPTTKQIRKKESIVYNLTGKDLAKHEVKGLRRRTFCSSLQLN